MSVPPRPATSAPSEIRLLGVVRRSIPNEVAHASDQLASPPLAAAEVHLEGRTAGESGSRRTQALLSRDEPSGPPKPVSEVSRREWQAWLHAGGDVATVRDQVLAWVDAHGENLKAAFVYKAWLDFDKGTLIECPAWAA